MPLKYTDRAIVRVPSKKPMAVKEKDHEDIAADRWLLIATAVMLAGAAAGDVLVELIRFWIN